MGLLFFSMPKSFLHLMSLRTGTELIVLTIIFNKISGLYGLLALLTGFHLSWLQLSMYIYSLAALILTATLAPHVRKQSPLQCLALAWFYLLDSLINAAYTAAFSISWYIVLLQHAAPGEDSDGMSPPGSKMIGDTAGFTDPVYNVSQVDAIVEPGEGSLAGPKGTLVGHNGGAVQRATGALDSVILEKGSIASIAIICTLWLIRLYFILVVIAYARAVLRAHIVRSSQSSSSFPSLSDGRTAENPFEKGKDLGEGWRGKLGRIMVAVGRPFWLATDETGDWEKSVGGRFASQSQHQQRRSRSEPKGVLERERRRRAGTGPSELRPIELDQVNHAPAQ